MKDFEKTLNEIRSATSFGTPVVKSLIDEIVLEQLYEDLSLQAPAPQPIAKLMQNEDYIRGVLGINIPLNESYPYSINLQQQILEEQLLLEGFFADFKKMKGDAKNLALAIRYMAEDGSRISDFVKTAYETVIKEPMTKILNFIKKVVDAVASVFKRFVMPKVQEVWEKIKEFLIASGEKLESAWESVKGMSGWKQALTVMAFGAGIGYLWKQQGLGDIVETAAKVVDDIQTVAKTWGKKVAAWIQKHGGKITGAVDLEKGTKALSLAKKGAKKESLSLSDALYDDAALNEFFGFFKKKAKGAKKAEKEVDKEEADEGLGVLEDAKAAIMEKLQPLFDVLQDKVQDMFTGVVKALGVEALVGMVSGGISTFINAIRAAFGGVSTLSDLFGDTLEGFVAQIKDIDKETKEAEQGKDDPTEATWHDNENLLREMIREKLLAAAS